MYEIIIRDYINKLTEKDIIEYGRKKNIRISEEDSKVLYLYAKNYWREFYRDVPNDLINELKEKLEPNTFNDLFKIYKNIKKKQANFK